MLLPAVVLGMLISFVLGLIFTSSKPELSFYLLPTRGWELMLGAVLALSLHNRQIQGRWLQVMGPLGLALIAASVVLYGPLTRVPGWFTLLPTLGTVALILGGFATTGLVTRLMASGPMVWIGKISYPLYLVHWPIRIFLQEHTLEFTLVWRVFGFGLSFMVATAIYYSLEMPIRQGRILAGRGLYMGVVTGLSISTVCISGLVMRSGGAPERFTPEVAEILDFRNDTPAPFEHCEHLGATLETMCGLGNPTAPREVLVVGDSHALALSGALDLWLAAEGRGGALAFQHGCMPVLGAGSERCQEAIQSVLLLAERSPQITEVVLVSIWRQALPEGGKQFYDRWVPEEDVAQVFTAQLMETEHRLHNAGKRVTLIEPLFAAARSVPETLASNIAFKRNWPVDTTLAEHRATFAPIFAAFDSLDNTNRVSLIEPFCADGTCHAVINGRPLFTDNNHLAFIHSRRIAALLGSSATAANGPLPDPYDPDR